MDKRNYIAINVYYKRSDNLCNFIARSQTANNSSDVVHVFYVMFLLLLRSRERLRNIVIRTSVCVCISARTSETTRYFS